MTKTKSGEGVYEAEERLDSQRISTMTDRNKIPGSDPASFANMMNDTRAPPHVGPFLWASIVLMMYTFRHTRGFPSVVWAATISLHIAYTELKRWQSKRRQREDLTTQLRSKTSTTTPTPTAPPLAAARRRALGKGENPWVRRALYAAQVVLFVISFTFGGSWMLCVAQVVLCAAFFLEHTRHIAHVRRVYCELGVGPLACRLQR
jgi:uncharacterized membrane protein